MTDVVAVMQLKSLDGTGRKKKKERQTILMVHELDMVREIEGK